MYQNCIEVMKQARSVISSINAAKHHALTMNDETVFWQREEWVRWALDEILPMIDHAIEQAEKQEPVGEVSQIDSDCDGQESAWVNLHNPVKLGQPLYTAPPQREPLTEAEIDEIWRTYLSRDERTRAIERKHGIGVDQ